MSENMNRRSFVGKTAAGVASTLLVGNALAGSAKGKKALLVYGGWKGHDPEPCKDIFAPWMEKVGFDLTVSDTLDSYTDEKLMSSLDVIVQSGRWVR